MNTVDEEKSEHNSKVERVRHAANTLGISERTVYRRLRSGKLEHLPLEVRRADTVTSIVSDGDSTKSVLDQAVSIMSDILCQHDMTNDKLAAIRQDIAHKDMQIRSLLENQQELTHTIQKLQAQIFELARLALLHPVSEQEKPQEPPFDVIPSPEPRPQGRRGWLWSLVNRGR